MNYSKALISTEKLLARVRLDVNLKKGVVQFELPDFGGARGGASGIVSDEVLEKYADVLLRESENWGIIELALGSTLSLEDDFDFGSSASSGGSKFYEKLFGKKQQQEEENDRPSYKPTEIYLSGYKPFCPYRVDLDFYKEARKSFTLEDDEMSRAWDIRFLDENDNEIKSIERGYWPIDKLEKIVSIIDEFLNNDVATEWLHNIIEA